MNIHSRTRAKYLLIFYSVKIYAQSNMDVLSFIWWNNLLKLLPSELLLLAQICTKSGGEGIGPIPKGRAGDLLLKERRGPTPNAPPPLDLLAPLLTKSWLYGPGDIYAGITSKRSLYFLNAK